MSKLTLGGLIFATLKNATNFFFKKEGIERQNNAKQLFPFFGIPGQEDGKARLQASCMNFTGVNHHWQSLLKSEINFRSYPCFHRAYP